MIASVPGLRILFTYAAIYRQRRKMLQLDCMDGQAGLSTHLMFGIRHVFSWPSSYSSMRSCVRSVVSIVAPDFVHLPILSKLNKSGWGSNHFCSYAKMDKNG